MCLDKGIVEEIHKDASHCDMWGEDYKGRTGRSPVYDLKIVSSDLLEWLNNADEEYTELVNARAGLHKNREALRALLRYHKAYVEYRNAWDMLTESSLPEEIYDRRRTIYLDKRGVFKDAKAALPDWLREEVDE
jgi:hypothetical protein